MNHHQLSLAQLQRLKEHKYRSQGTSVSEVFMQPYWRWLVTKVPLWVAPNLITFVGLVLNLFTTVLVVLYDLNCEGAAPRWMYFANALGYFIYQSLDAIDGKQARRTGSNTPLGELFDHGCDAVSTYLVVVSGISAIGLHDYPKTMLGFIVLVLCLNFFYHWQTYVSGVLYFKRVDVTEAQFLHMAVLLFTAFFGIEAWQYVIPGLGVSIQLVTAWTTLALSTVNLIHASYIILTSGVGKNGSTVADTSVVSPIVTVLVLAPLPFLYESASPSLLHNNCQLFFLAMCLPFVKTVIIMVLSGMTKSPFPLLDPIMLGPLLAYLNVYFGAPLPEFYVMIAVALHSVVDISVMCVRLCRQICDYLEISCFTIPFPPPNKSDPH